MVKTAVKVYVRTRPSASKFDGLKVQADGGINIRMPKQEDAGLINNQLENLSFKFDGVLENVNQEAVYTGVAHEVVEGVLAGINGTLFCYGQTGAGKTFTMSGDQRQYAHRGIIPRAMHHIFREIDLKSDKLYSVQVSYLEIYNEQLYDLLSDNPASSDALTVLEDKDGNSYVRNLTKVKVMSEEEALSQFFIGEQGRSVASHVLNAGSSRSHVIYTIHVEMRTSEEASERAVLSKLHLVDLAGSERTKKTGVTGQTLKEAHFINKSLSFLEQTVNSLSRRDAHTAFRQTKLTSVLRDALGGNCRTVMVANVWPEADHVEETVSTLRFATRVKTLVTDVFVNESTDQGLLLRRYERQIKELKQELAMRDTLSGKGRVSYEDFSEADLRDLNALSRKYLQGEAEVEVLQVDSLKQIRETFRQMRSVFQASRQELMAAHQAMRTETAGTPGLSVAPLDMGAIGDVDKDGRGFGIGNAPANARPPTVTQMRGHLDIPGSPMPGSSPNSPGAASSPGTRFASDGAAVFARFKAETSEGRELNTKLKVRLTELADVKKQVQNMALQVNARKAAIEAVQTQLASKKLSTPPPPDGVLDSEQYDIMAQLSAAKSTYRTSFDQLKEARDMYANCQRQADDTRQTLLTAYEDWAGGGSIAPPTGDEDELDAGEAFERMQIGNIRATDPDSVSYFAAKKKSAAAVTLRGSSQFAGTSKAAATATRKTEQEQRINLGLARG